MANLILPFFVYGTLRPGESNYLKLLAHIDIENRSAQLEGAVLHDGPGYPYMFEADIGTVVGDLVYICSDPNDYTLNLQRLDELEGFDPKATEPSQNHYERKRVVVSDSDAQKVQAWAYFAGEQITAKDHTKIESGDWLKR